jgi:hypothetical protein
MARAITVRELFTTWGFDIDEAPLKRVDGSIDKMKRGLALARLGIASAVAGLLGAAKYTADAGDEAVNTAQKLGLTAEAYQELAYAVRVSDVEQGSFTSGMDILASTARSAAEGGKEAAKALAAVGVSARDSNGRLKPSSDLLLEISAAFAAMDDQQRKLAPGLARGIFGRGGTAMLPLLFQGPEAIRALMAESRNLGGVLSEVQAQAGDDFNDDLFRLFTAIKGIRNEIGSQLLPLLNPLVNQLREWLSANRELIGSSIAPFLRLLGDLFAAGLSTAMALGQALLHVVEAVSYLVSALRPLIFLLVAFAAGEAILAAVSIAKAIWAAVLAMQALNFQLLLANALTGFVPLLLGLGALGADYAVRGDRSVMGSLFGGGAAAAIPMPGLAGAGRSVTNVTEIKPQINVSVPASNDPVTHGAAVGQAAHHEMSKLLRQSMHDLQPQTE